MREYGKIGEKCRIYPLVPFFYQISEKNFCFFFLLFLLFLINYFSFSLNLHSSTLVNGSLVLLFSMRKALSPHHVFCSAMWSTFFFPFPTSLVLLPSISYTLPPLLHRKCSYLLNSWRRSSISIFLSYSILPFVLRVLTSQFIISHFCLFHFVCIEPYLVGVVLSAHQHIFLSFSLSPDSCLYYYYTFSS